MLRPLAAVLLSLTLLGTASPGLAAGFDYVARLADSGFRISAKAQLLDSGAVLGAINGLLVWRLSIPPIVVTLGTMTIYRGTIFLLTGGAWVNAHEMTDAFKAVPRAVFLGIPVLAWFSLAVIALMMVVLIMTRLGRAFYY